MRRLQIMILAASLAGLTACEDTAGPGFEAGASTATLSFAVAAPGAGTTAPGPQQVVLQDASGRSLDLERVRVVLEEAELERANDDDCVDGDDRCEKFEVGFQLVDLPLEGGVITPFSTRIPADVYDELEVEIDEPGDDSTSAAFRAAHPSWPRDRSMRLTGTFDANDGAGPQPFDVYLEVDLEIERELVPPLVVTEETDPATVNVTVLLDVDRWFRASNGSLIDPAAIAASDDLLDAFEDRIEESFEAFEDDDADGIDDDDDDDDGSKDDDDGV